MMIVQYKREMVSPVMTVLSDSSSGHRSPEPEDECMPLDLSVHRLGSRDSGTDSDDSGGRCSPEGADCKAYKKSLIKRYCKSRYLCLLHLEFNIIYQNLRINNTKI